MPLTAITSARMGASNFDAMGGHFAVKATKRPAPARESPRPRERPMPVKIKRISTTELAHAVPNDWARLSTDRKTDCDRTT
jgi:hypothetical protein